MSSVLMELRLATKSWHETFVGIPEIESGREAVGDREREREYQARFQDVTEESKKN